MIRFYRNRWTIFFAAFVVFVVTLLAQTRLPQGPYGVIFRATTAIGTATLNTTQMVGLLNGTPTGAATYTTPTATQMCSALPQIQQVSGGTNTNYAHRLVVINTSGGANTITMAAGAGWSTSGGLTIAQNQAHEFLVYPTACPNAVTGLPAAAWVLQSVGAASTF